MAESNNRKEDKGCSSASSVISDHSIDIIHPCSDYGFK